MNINSKSDDIQLGVLNFADRCIFGKTFEPGSCPGRTLGSGPPYYGKCKACYEKTLELLKSREKECVHCGKKNANTSEECLQGGTWEHWLEYTEKVDESDTEEEDEEERPAIPVFDTEPKTYFSWDCCGNRNKFGKGCRQTAPGNHKLRGSS